MLPHEGGKPYPLASSLNGLERGAVLPRCKRVGIGVFPIDLLVWAGNSQGCSPRDLGQGVKTRHGIGEVCREGSLTWGANILKEVTRKLCVSLANDYSFWLNRKKYLFIKSGPVETVNGISGAGKGTKLAGFHSLPDRICTESRSWQKQSWWPEGRKFSGLVLN